MTFRVLDLFCGAGGAGMGYNRAGFDVVGVDIEFQPRYPFEFIKGDALDFVRDGGAEGFDLIHASPPCQRHSALTKGFRNDQLSEYPDLIADTRKVLLATGIPYIIENVPAAPLHDFITLCGEMFGLRVIRHRIFECAPYLKQPKHIKHRGLTTGWMRGSHQQGYYTGVYGHGGGKGSLEDWQEAMDISWMETRPELSQAIPPAYTEYLGTQMWNKLTGGDPDVGGSPSRRAEATCTECGRRTFATVVNSGLS